MNVADEIGKLNKLKMEGALTEEEFQKAKTSLLAKNDSAGEPIKRTVNEVAADTNMWGMFIHLAQFAGLVIPYAGFIVPIVLWQIKKDESDIIDKHGKNVTNWIITETIAFFSLLILTVLTLGIGGIAFIPFAVVAVVFPIIGAVKANSGEVWVYPMSIKFFKLDDSTPAPATATLPPKVPTPSNEDKPTVDAG